MRKIKKIILLTKEKDILGWFSNNRIRVFLFLAASILLWLVSSLPYLNLILSSDFVYFCVAIFAVIAFIVSLRNLVIFCLLLFVLALFLTLAGAVESAEVIGNFIYFILIYITIKFIFNEA